MQARPRGMKQFIERRIVVLPDLLGVGDVEPQRIDERRAIALPEIGRQIAMRHQVEHADFHGAFSSAGGEPEPIAIECNSGVTNSDTLSRAAASADARRETSPED